MDERVAPVTISPVTSGAFIQRALIQRALDPAIGSPATPPATTTTPPPGVYGYPLPEQVTSEIETVCATVSAAPGDFEYDLFLLHGVREYSGWVTAEATLNFFFSRFRELFEMLYLGVRREIFSDFPDAHHRAEQEFNYLVSEQVYRSYILPLATDYFLDNPSRLQQLRQRRPLRRPREGEGLA